MKFGLKLIVLSLSATIHSDEAFVQPTPCKLLHGSGSHVAFMPSIHRLPFPTGLITRDIWTDRFLVISARQRSSGRGAEPNGCLNLKFSATSRVDFLKKLPRVYPSVELLSRAQRKASFVKEDTSIQNARARCRKLAAERLSAFSKELTKPLGSLLEGYEAILRGLPPFESVVVELTVRHRLQL
jgi:hypothetical protein